MGFFIGKIKVIKTIRDNIDPPYSLHDMNVILAIHIFTWCNRFLSGEEV